MRMILIALAVLVLMVFGAESAVAQETAEAAQEMDTWETFVHNVRQRLVAELGEEEVTVWVQDPLSWGVGPELDAPKLAEFPGYVTRDFPPDLTREHFLAMSYVFPTVPQIVTYSARILRIVVGGISIAEAARRVWDWIVGDDGPEPPPGTQINIETNNGTIVITTGEALSSRTGN